MNATQSLVLCSIILDFFPPQLQFILYLVHFLETVISDFEPLDDFDLNLGKLEVLNLQGQKVVRQREKRKRARERKERESYIKSYCWVMSVSVM